MSPRQLGYATLAVLQALTDGARYGFDIVDRTGLPSGTVYPALAALERRSLVTSRWESDAAARAEARPRRRYYRVTAEGSRALREAARRWGELGLGGLAPVRDTGPAGS
ncbi:MAG: PadR family transcriptional regulator [Longimicrobiales bacterium]